MLEGNSPAYLFRFMQLRPAAPIDQSTVLTAPPTAPISHIQNAEASSGKALRDEMIKQLGLSQDPFDGIAMHLKMEEASGAEDLDSFRSGTRQLLEERAFEQDYELLRNRHYVSLFEAAAATRAFRAEIERMLALYVLASSNPLPWMAEMEFGLLQRLTVIFSRELPDRTNHLGPVDLTHVNPISNPQPVIQEQRPSEQQLARSLQSLSLLRATPIAIQSADETKDDKCSRKLGALTAFASAQLPDDIKQTIDLLGLSIDDPVDDIVSAISIAASLNAIVPFFPFEDESLGNGGGLKSDGRVRPAGVGDLLVVKQHIKGYETSDIAHIENVMAGEERSRSHRALDRMEEVFLEEDEMTRETNEELETAERHEMNKEVAKTLKNDRKLGFELSLSGKYGPTVEFSSNLALEASTSSEESSRSASRFAREIMAKSTERIVERRRTEHQLTVLRETEEINEHNFSNDDGDHIVGQYQFVEKVEENQIFNYGKRLMFDIMVPEPASYFWFLDARSGEQVSLPVPPDPIGDHLADASVLSEMNYMREAARYGATDINPPPPLTRIVHGAHQSGPGADEGGHPRATQKIDLEVPKGFIPEEVDGVMTSMTDAKQSFRITVGNGSDGEIKFEGRPVGDGKKIESNDFRVTFDDSALGTDSNRLTLNLLVFETANWTISARLKCVRSNETFQQWQLDTFKSIRRAYEDRVADYEQRLAQAQATQRQRDQEAENLAASTPYGDAPITNQIRILQELKKHCISIITRNDFDSFGSIAYADEPRIRFDEAMAEGSYIRFFEQAFEWEQMQYVFYPYYWAARSRWKSRLRVRDNDRLFEEFLRAGEARVIVPVRPGFERAINYYLETGLLWEGDDLPPLMGDSLYVSVITEIEERTGRGKGEIPVGESWQSRLPTSLVRLRPEDQLPEWENRAPEGWDWHETSGDG